MPVQTPQLIEVKDALVALCETALADEGTQVSWGHPGKAIDQECVYVGDVLEDEKAANLGNGRRAEMIRAQIVCNVMMRDEQRAASLRVAQLAGKVNAAIRGSNTLGLSAVTFAEVTASPLREGFRDDFREAEIQMTVSVKTRLGSS